MLLQQFGQLFQEDLLSLRSAARLSSVRTVDRTHAAIDLPLPDKEPTYTQLFAESKAADSSDKRTCEHLLQLAPALPLPKPGPLGDRPEHHKPSKHAALPHSRPAA